MPLAPQDHQLGRLPSTITTGHKTAAKTETAGAARTSAGASTTTSARAVTSAGESGVAATGLIYGDGRDASTSLKREREEKVEEEKSTKKEKRTELFKCLSS